jgi:hemerythrin superfamily protein
VAALQGFFEAPLRLACGFLSQGSGRPSRKGHGTSNAHRGDEELAMNAVIMLTEEHRMFGELYKRYLAAQTPRFREDVARRLLQEAHLHIALEEKYVYPIARERSEARLDEHVQAKLSLAQLNGMDVHDWRFPELLGTFVQDLLEHSELEEKLFFPLLRKTMRRTELEALGRVIQNAREERPAAPVAAGLMSRAATHVVSAWKAQLSSALERACSAVLGIKESSPGTANT